MIIPQAIPKINHPKPKAIKTIPHIQYMFSCLYISFRLVVATSRAMKHELIKNIYSAISKSAELSSSVKKSALFRAIQCKAVYLDATARQLFIGFRRPSVPLSIVQKICLSYLPLSAERSSDALSERATKLESKTAPRSYLRAAFPYGDGFAHNGNFVAIRLLRTILKDDMILSMKPL